MKKSLIILIIALVIGGGVWYLASRPNDQTSSYTKKSVQNSSQQQDFQPSVANTTQSSSDKSTQTPAPDVSTTFSIGSGSPEPKTVSAKKGQRVALTFTNSNINDQVLIEGYDVNTYIIPLSESTIEFPVDKTGSFNITLAKKKTTIGTLKIN